MKSLALLLCLVVVASCASAGVPADYDARAHGGTWWLALADDQRDGFVSGYADCYRYDLALPEYPGGSRMQWVARMTDAYRKGGEALAEPAGDLLIKVGKALPRREDPEPTVHGYFDGDFWRQISERARVEFVRGYLQCRASLRPAALSKPPAVYVNEISKWFGIDPADVAEIDESREGTKIADVLLKLRD